LERETQLQQVGTKSSQNFKYRDYIEYKTLSCDTDTNTWQ